MAHTSEWIRDSEGCLGTVNRRGRAKGGACCGSAAAAAAYFLERRKGPQITDNETAASPSDPIDSQQHCVNQLLLPFEEQLEQAADKRAELPRALFQAQNELVHEIVARGCSKLSSNDKMIALVGGIQINTPGGMSDYFQPLKFELRSNKGVLLEAFIPEKSTSMLSISTKFTETF